MVTISEKEKRKIRRYAEKFTPEVARELLKFLVRNGNPPEVLDTIPITPLSDEKRGEILGNIERLANGDVYVCYIAERAVRCPAFTVADGSILVTTPVDDDTGETWGAEVNNLWYLGFMAPQIEEMQQKGIDPRGKVKPAICVSVYMGKDDDFPRYHTSDVFRSIKGREIVRFSELLDRILKNQEDERMKAKI